MTDSGKLFLGGAIDPDSGDRIEPDVRYSAHHLTTHGVIVGMTGSGKTGLGVVLLEEALLSGIPALVIDPKGDMGNLLLNFPEFQTQDFRPWIDEGEAQRKGSTANDAAQKAADMWQKGLASWGIDADRMRRLGTQADFTIYTPGSQAGVPLNVVGSLGAPKGGFSGNEEALREEIQGYVTSLLTLADIESDPIASPEHILLSNLIERAWTAGDDLDLGTLITQVMAPPLRRLGVFDLDAFFPKKARTQLAMRLNGLVASPSFASWLTGEPIDIQSLLYTPDGRPRAAIVYLNHLTDTERQFVVTLLLSKMITWMRRQQGTSELRALVYMDEVYGFAPPTAMPPSKKPILTLLKQARAFGVGMVLSTQNPVDLDYKAMSNAGTWMVGRLQTERDKARILEGMTSASGEVDVAALDKLVGGLGKRQFVLHNTRSSQPTLFTTRWAQSYLCGPLTREHIQTLMKPKRTADAPTSPVATAVHKPPAAARPAAPATATQALPQVAPTVAANVGAYYMASDAPWASQVGASLASTHYKPAIVARVSLLFDDTRAKVDHREEWEAIYFPLEDDFDPKKMLAVDYDERDLTLECPRGASYSVGDGQIASATYFRSAEKSVKEHLYRNRSVQVMRNTKLKLYSRVGESEAEFIGRCDAMGQDRADNEVAKLRASFAKKVKRALDSIENTERKIRDLEVAVQQRQQQEVLSGAGQVLSMFLSGRARARSLNGFASRHSTTVRTQQRLSSAQDKLTSQHESLSELEAQFTSKVAEINAHWDEIAGTLETVDIGLERADVSVDELALVWIPVNPD